eukprot:scaffold279_cov61-Phaeocystis_antarctica.AAC.3
MAAGPASAPSPSRAARPGMSPTYGRPDPISAAPSAMGAFSGILRRATGPSTPPIIATSPEACVENTSDMASRRGPSGRWAEAARCLGAA